MRRDPFSRVISLGTAAIEDVGEAAERHRSAVRDRHLQAANGVEVPADFGRTPDHHVEEPLLVVELPDLRSLDECRRCPPDLPGRESEHRPSLRAKPHSDLGYENLRLHLQIDDTGNPTHRLAHRLSLRLEPLQIGSVDTHDDRGAGAGQHLFDALA